MITKEQFIEILTLMEKYNKEVDKWDEFGIPIIERSITIIPFRLFDLFLNHILGEQGLDWVNWYLYERLSISTGEVLPCFHEDSDIEIYIRTPEDLWDFTIKDIINGSTNK